MANSQFKNTSPLVSVIIPTYNGESFLQQAIDSVFDQTFQDFELIITDDASNDGTQKIVSQYQNDSRLSFFQNKSRLGIGGNWNYGIKQSRGKYIKLLCQDDILKPNYLEKVIDVLERDSSISLVTTFEQFFGESDRIRDERDIPFSTKVEGRKAQNSVLKKGNWIGGPTAVIFRRINFTVENFDTSLKCGLDYEMWLRLLGEGYLYIIPRILFQSRIHGGQATTGCNENLGFDKDKIRILKKMRESPENYGGINSEVVQEALEHSVRIFVDKSLKNKEIRISSVWQFLYQNTDFSISIRSLIVGVILLSLKWFRQALKTE